MKTLVIGLDGVPFTLLKDFMDKGYLPEFSRILSGDKLELRQMDASIPDVSSTSWTSFMTGVNPGEHGIYGFLGLEPNSYNLYFPNFTNVKAPTIWDILGKTVNATHSTLLEKYADKVKHPLRSIVLNIPQTFPAKPMNGVLTAGFVCPDLRKGTYPEAAYNYLTSIGYTSDVDAAKMLSDKDEFIKDLFSALEKRAVSYEHFFQNEQWDMFFAVVTETDRLHHFFFDAAMDSGHPHNPMFVDFYRKVDKFVGKLYDLFMDMTNGDGTFLTMSDHGFTPIQHEVYLNAWLQQKGLLKLNPAKQYFEQIDSGTKVFVMDPGRFYVNLEDKYPAGSVKKAEKETVIDELKSMLKSLTGPDGKPVIKTIHEKKDIYTGNFLDDAPDLVCVANDGFDLKGTLARNEPFGRTHFTGMHTAHDAHCILPSGMAGTEKLKIEDIAGLMLDNIIVS